MPDAQAGDDGDRLGSTLAGPRETAWAAATPYVPSLLLETLRGTPPETPTRIDPLDGTLVFADISGFTALSERLAEMGKEGAERLTNIINSNFERMLDITRDHGGSNLKFGGDAMLLAFIGEDHAYRADPRRPRSGAPQHERGSAQRALLGRDRWRPGATDAALRARLGGWRAGRH